MNKYLYILILVLISIPVVCQTKGRVSSSSQETFEKRALERQLSYAQASEKRGDIASAYNNYAQLIKKYDSEVRVITGFIDMSVKTGRIKDCEIKLKEIANKYPVKNGVMNKGTSNDVYPLKIRGFLAEFFLRTSREENAYQLFTEIDKTGADKLLISEIKAAAFYRAGLFQAAEKIYLNLRKETKNEKAYSEELYNIYIASGRISGSVGELFKMIEPHDAKEGKVREVHSFNPEAELFRIYEKEEFKDSILKAAEKLPKTERNSIILSELYFNSGIYDKAFSVLKNSIPGGNGDLLISDYAVRLYSEKKYTEACSFFELSLKKSADNRTDDFTALYIECLKLSGQAAKAVKVIKSSGLKNKELILAEIYHNGLDSLIEADRLYKKNLTGNKSHTEFWKDYVKLKIALKDYKSAKVILSRVFDEQIIDIFTNTGFYEFKYMDAVIDLMAGDSGSFINKAEILVRDDFISDYDNDLLKISSDFKAIAADKELMTVYIEALGHRTDRKFRLNGIYKDFPEDLPADKRIVIYETNLYILIAQNEQDKVADLLNEMMDKNILNNTTAKMFTEYSRLRKNEEKINSLLILLLKSSISNEIKTEIREIIRNKPLS